MHTTSATFTTGTSLINAGDVVDNPKKALSVTPEGIGPMGGLTPIEQAILCELNRFPGAVAFTFVPKGEALRETILANVKERAEAYEAANPKHPSNWPAYVGIFNYVQNLRDLFLIANLDAGEAIQQPDPFANIKQDLSTAVEFALSKLDDFEIGDFLRDWRADVDLSPWLNAHKMDQKTASGDWTGHDTLAS